MYLVFLLPGCVIIELLSMVLLGLLTLLAIYVQPVGTVVIEYWGFQKQILAGNYVCDAE